MVMAIEFFCYSTSCFLSSLFLHELPVCGVYTAYKINYCQLAHDVYTRIAIFVYYHSNPKNANKTNKQTDKYPTIMHQAVEPTHGPGLLGTEAMHPMLLLQGTPFL
jgi:hypothetical protein